TASDQITVTLTVGRRRQVGVGAPLLKHLTPARDIALAVLEQPAAGLALKLCENVRLRSRRLAARYPLDDFHLLGVERMGYFMDTLLRSIVFLQDHQNVLQRFLSAGSRQLDVFPDAAKLG